MAIVRKFTSCPDIIEQKIMTTAGPGVKHIPIIHYDITLEKDALDQMAPEDVKDLLYKLFMTPIKS